MIIVVCASYVNVTDCWRISCHVMLYHVNNNNVMNCMTRILDFVFFNNCDGNCVEKFHEPTLNYSVIMINGQSLIPYKIPFFDNVNLNDIQRLFSWLDSCVIYVWHNTCDSFLHLEKKCVYSSSMVQLKYATFNTN